MKFELQATSVVIILVALFLIRVVVSHTADLCEATRDSVCALLSDLIAVVAIVYFLLRPFVIQTFFIPSGSMMPTMRENDRILVNSFICRFRPPRRGEIAVFYPPPAAAESLEEVERPEGYVKRVVGLPGERLRTDRDGVVYVDGRLLREPYVAPESRASYLFPEDLLGRDRSPGHRVLKGELGQTFELDVIPSPEHPDRLEAITRSGQYWMLGDNRAHSRDGHKWGFVSREAFVGRAIFVFWPPHRFGFVE